MQPLEEFSRQVRCFCRSSVVVSRMDSAWDEFVVCSRGCFDNMVASKPQYWSVVYGVMTESDRHG